MGRGIDSVKAINKERRRAEIEKQVQQFLQKGGQIKNVSQHASNEQTRRGSVWQTLYDDIGLTGQDAF